MVNEHSVSALKGAIAILVADESLREQIGRRAIEVAVPRCGECP